MSHFDLRTDDLGTNRLSTNDSLVAGDAVAGPGARAFSAGRLSFCTSADGLSGCVGFGGNSALDQPRTRSSAADTAALSDASESELRVSDAVSLPSKYASFGMSKFGALPFSTVARTEPAKFVSGRFHEP
jgi:hypothetical protein